MPSVKHSHTLTTPVAFHGELVSSSLVQLSFIKNINENINGDNYVIQLKKLAPLYEKYYLSLYRILVLKTIRNTKYGISSHF
jgi:hypothetical protein